MAVAAGGAAVGNRNATVLRLLHGGSADALANLRPYLDPRYVCPATRNAIQSGATPVNQPRMRVAARRNSRATTGHRHQLALPRFRMEPPPIRCNPEWGVENEEPATPDKSNIRSKCGGLHSSKVEEARPTSAHLGWLRRRLTRCRFEYWPGFEAKRNNLN